VTAAPRARAATVEWQGHTWQLTSGGMAGVCQGDPANVTVDGSGYLHLRIAHAGGTWSASELFTTDELGFGTYQWQVEGPIDTYDKNVVLGLFPYGPQAGLGGDGTNEIDIEYSRWGQANGPNGDFTVYPATGTTIGELSYSFTLSGLASTSRLSWSDTGVIESLFDGFEPLATSSAPLKTWTYMPSQASKNIPQAALPLGINLWCFDSPPSDANPVEIVIRSFEFLPQGAAGGAGGMAGGANSAGGAGASAGASAGAGAGGRRGSPGAGQAGASAVSRGGRPGVAGAATNAGAAAGTVGGEASGHGGAAGAETSGGATSSGGLGPAGEGGRASGADSSGGRSSVSGGPSSDSAAPVRTRSSGCDCSLASEGGALGYLGESWLIAIAWLVRRRRRR
jgi:hypothetical protein